MSIVDLAREIGRELQKDKDYLSFKGLEKACDEDKELQDLIGEFNLKRMSLNDEASKADRDEDKIARLNNELRICYGKVMENENMAAYNKAKTSFENKVQQAIGIITQCAEGADPDTAEGVHSCDCDCSSCGGCH